MGEKPPKSYTSSVGAVLVMPSASDSQCALTMRIALGLGSARAQTCSSRIQGPSSKVGGAPWERYSAGSGASPGVHGRCVPAASTAATCRRLAANGWRGSTSASAAAVLPRGAVVTEVSGVDAGCGSGRVAVPGDGQQGAGPEALEVAAEDVLDQGQPLLPGRLGAEPEDAVADGDPAPGVADHRRPRDLGVLGKGHPAPEVGHQLLGVASRGVGGDVGARTEESHRGLRSIRRPRGRPAEGRWAAAGPPPATGPGRQPPGRRTAGAARPCGPG